MACSICKEEASLCVSLLRTAAHGKRTTVGTVIPVKTGIQHACIALCIAGLHQAAILDSRLRGNDDASGTRPNSAGIPARSAAAIV